MNALRFENASKVLKDAVKIRLGGKIVSEDGLDFVFRDSHDSHEKKCSFSEVLSSHKIKEYPEGSMFVYSGKQTTQKHFSYVVFHVDEVQINILRHYLVPVVYLMDDLGSEEIRKNVLAEFDRHGDSVRCIYTSDIQLRFLGIYRGGERMLIVNTMLGHVFYEPHVSKVGNPIE